MTHENLETPMTAGPTDFTTKPTRRAGGTPNPKKPRPKRAAADNLLRGPLEMHAGHKVMRLLGYWAIVQTLGGWEAVAEQPFWSEGSIVRWRLEFLDVFGVHAEDYVPEVGPVLHAALYGPGETRTSPGGIKVQQEALVVLAATKAARKGAR